MTIPEFIIIVLNVATLIAVIVSNNNRTPRPPAVQACYMGSDIGGPVYETHFKGLHYE